MDIVLPGLRDRRVAAADENLTRRGFQIYGDGSRARILSNRSYGHRTGRFDVRNVRLPTQRRLINTVVLHQTNFFSAEALPADALDSRIESNHRLDVVIAHFIVRANGIVVYIRDIEYILNSVSGRHGIDIEFEGAYGNEETPSSPRLSSQAIVSGRRLISALIGALPHLHYIHPHGQIQADPVKLHTCCGPDIWINVGEWAANNLYLVCDSTASERPNNGISDQQRNNAYNQHIETRELTISHTLNQILHVET